MIKYTILVSLAEPDRSGACLGSHLGVEFNLYCMCFDFVLLAPSRSTGPLWLFVRLVPSHPLKNLVPRRQCDCFVLGVWLPLDDITKLVVLTIDFALSNSSASCIRSEYQVQ